MVLPIMSSKGISCDVFNYLTRQTDHYHLPIFHTDLGRSSIRYYGAVLWNNIIFSDVSYECTGYLLCKKIKHKHIFYQIMDLFKNVLICWYYFYSSCISLANQNGNYCFNIWLYCNHLHPLY